MTHFLQDGRPPCRPTDCVKGTACFDSPRLTFCRDGRLVAEAQQDDRRWTTSWAGPKTDRWYFVELTWHRRRGLKMYVDLELIDSDSSAVAQQRKQVPVDGDHAYLGADLTRANYGSVRVDDLEFWFGERSKLIELDFISRGNLFMVTALLQQQQSRSPLRFYVSLLSRVRTNPLQVTQFLHMQRAVIGGFSKISSCHRHVLYVLRQCVAEQALGHYF